MWGAVPARCLLISLLALCLLFAAASAQTCNDTVFVKQSQDAAYLGVTGDISELTCDHLIMTTKDSARRLYSRDVVRRVELDPNCKSGRGPDPNNPFDKTISWSQLSNRCWNRETPALVSLVETLVPKEGPGLRDIPPGLDTFFAWLIVVVVIFYAAYQGYDFWTAARRVNALNREKLEMEVSKQRFELDDLKKKKMALTSGIGLETVKSELDFSAPLGAMRQLHVGDFFKHALLGIPTERDASHLTELWQNRWQSYRSQKTDPAPQYQLRRVGNYLVTILALLLCVFSFLLVCLFLSPWGDQSGPMFAPSVFFLFVGVIALRLFIRRNATRRIMSETYAAARSSAT